MDAHTDALLQRLGRVARYETRLVRYVELCRVMRRAAKVELKRVRRVKNVLIREATPGVA